MKKYKREDKLYPQKLIDIKPKVEEIYINGDIENLNKPIISIIGSRNCSEKGIKIAKKISKELSNYGFVIASGMAIGIDRAAHEGCIQAGGKTIAVLGSGFNHIYPKENDDLYREIIETGGTVITEYEPKTKPNKKFFPARNRIVSGISEGVVVIEAGYRSGTTITAKLAKKQGKKVFCIPNEINNKYGIGTNELIKKGAILITSSKDVVKNLEINLNLQMNCNKKSIYIKSEYKDVFDVISKGKINVNNIVKKTKKSINEVQMILTMLELEEKIIELPGKEYIINE